MKTLLALLFSIMLTVAGCASLDDKAAVSNAALHEATKQIGLLTTEAHTKIQSSSALLTSTTQPSPEIIRQVVEGLSSADGTLLKIPPVLREIDKHGDDLQGTTNEATKKLIKEENHWLGYKARMVLYTFSGLLAFGGLVFIVITLASSGTLAPLGLLLLTLLRLAKVLLTKALVYLLHLLTLGLSWLALHAHRNSTNGSNQSD